MRMLPLSLSLSLSLSHKETFWRLRRKVKAYWASVFSPAPKTQRVLIFAQGRTGSTVLESLLVSTRRFEERGEMLGANNEPVHLPARCLRGMARRTASTRMKKINARPLQQTVIRYDDALPN